MVYTYCVWSYYFSQATVPERREIIYCNILHERHSNSTHTHARTLSVESLQILYSYNANTSTTTTVHELEIYPLLQQRASYICHRGNDCIGHG